MNGCKPQEKRWLERWTLERRWKEHANFRETKFRRSAGAEVQTKFLESDMQCLECFWKVKWSKGEQFADRFMHKNVKERFHSEIPSEFARDRQQWTNLEGNFRIINWTQSGFTFFECEHKLLTYHQGKADQKELQKVHLRRWSFGLLIVEILEWS